MKHIQPTITHREAAANVLASVRRCSVLFVETIASAMQVSALNNVLVSCVSIARIGVIAVGGFTWAPMIGCRRDSQLRKCDGHGMNVFSAMISANKCVHFFNKQLFGKQLFNNLPVNAGYLTNTVDANNT